MTEEIVLSGGNVNTSVVRVGSTVRRTQSSNGMAVHALLKHLRSRSFVQSPAFLGIDEKGREILSYFDGEASISPFYWKNDNTLLAVAGLLRKMHDATVDLPFYKYNWVQSYPDQTKHEVICHNDFAPYNIVCSSEIPVGIIDFDLAGPGPRARDVAYALYWMCPMSMAAIERLKYTEQEISNGCIRAKLFCVEYGIEFNSDILDMIGEVLSDMGNKARAERLVGIEAANKLESDGHLSYWINESRAFGEAKHLFLAAV